VYYASQTGIGCESMPHPPPGDPPVPSINVGDKAPPFEATLQDGSTFDSASLLGRKSLVLFFYPKDNTPVCTQQACAFRDAYAQFVGADVEVVGVSSDSPESHQRFAARHSLPFPIISDSRGALRRLFGVPRALGIFPGRVTYVIDKEGVVRMAYNATLAAEPHVRKALEAVGAAAGVSPSKLAGG
jgi:thioredoxin-dependent peroxiredoxin